MPMELTTLILGMVTIGLILLGQGRSIKSEAKKDRKEIRDDERKEREKILTSLTEVEKEAKQEREIIRKEAKQEREKILEVLNRVQETLNSLVESMAYMRGQVNVLVQRQTNQTADEGLQYLPSTAPEVPSTPVATEQ